VNDIAVFISLIALYIALALLASYFGLVGTL
jgi:hypothetical protein